METEYIHNTTLILGDCLEKMKDIPDKSIDMILCDLPYGITACKWDVIIPFEPLWAQYKRIIKNNGVIALTASQPFTSALVMSNLTLFKYEWIWDKGSPSNWASSSYSPMKEHEEILIFYKDKPTFNQQRIFRSEYSLKCHPIGSKHVVPSSNKKSETNNIVGASHSYSEDGMRCPRSIINIKLPKGRGMKSLHPTQKPVALLEYFISTYTNENETVLDNCMGSGSTGVACVNTNRKFIGIELDKTYYDIACNRINQHVVN